MQQQTSDEWPLRRLNLFAMPISIGLAIWGRSSWWSLLMAAASGGVVAHVIATLWVGRLRQQLKQMEHSSPLMHVYYEKIQGLTDPSLQIRFIFMQSLSGALIGAFWFAIAFGVVSLLT